MITKESASQISRYLVACNIYISAGRPCWAPFLRNLLLDAQDECTRLRKLSQPAPLAVVHAFADGPYDRSSFHLAGSSTLVASLASHIAVKAATSLSRLRRHEDPDKERSTEDKSADTSTTHPTVGLVDHVAVLPLPGKGYNDDHVTFEEWKEAFEADNADSIESSIISHSSSMKVTTHTGWVARTIGDALDEIGVQIYWYGHSDPDQTPLAEVRKHKTTFFESLPMSQSSMGQATVGAPAHFVENYNIQVATHEKKAAQSLTKWVRTRDGGLPFVEALTLPYGSIPVHDEGLSRQQHVPLYEVACNLLNPSVTSTQHIDELVQTWKTQGGIGAAVDVRSSYRVGTTVEMCLNVLERVASEGGEREHNRKVREKMEGFLE